MFTKTQYLETSGALSPDPCPPDKRMFGVPLCVNVRQTGKALPNAILHAMTHIKDAGGLG